MSTGKYLSLEEAQKEKELDRFAKEHPSKGDRKRFDKLLTDMSSVPEGAEQRQEEGSGTTER